MLQQEENMLIYFILATLLLSFNGYVLTRKDVPEAARIGLWIGMFYGTAQLLIAVSYALS